MTAPGDWMKTADWLANSGHVLAGAVVVLTAALFSRGSPLVCFVVGAMFFALVLFKEFYIDLRFESGEDVTSSTVDALGYTAGMGLAAGAVALAHALGVLP